MSSLFRISQFANSCSKQLLNQNLTGKLYNPPFTFILRPYDHKCNVKLKTRFFLIKKIVQIDNSPRLTLMHNINLGIIYSLQLNFSTSKDLCLHALLYYLIYIFIQNGINILSQGSRSSTYLINTTLDKQE